MTSFIFFSATWFVVYLSRWFYGNIFSVEVSLRQILGKMLRKEIFSVWKIQRHNTIKLLLNCFRDSRRDLMGFLNSNVSLFQHVQYTTCWNGWYSFEKTSDWHVYFNCNRSLETANTIHPIVDLELT